MTQTADQIRTSVIAPPSLNCSAATLQSGLDFTDARLRMVNDQVRPVEVNDPRVLTAMRELPRQDAVPVGQELLAYADRSLPLGHGRYLLQPMIVARLVQMAQIVPEQRVLVVGAATGYLASVISVMGAKVVALEDEDDLLTTGQAYTARHAPGLVWRKGALTEGNEQDAPFDLIIFGGAIAEIPAFCNTQIAEGGRVAGVLRSPDGTSSAFLAEQEAPGNWSIRRFFDAVTPMLPAFEKTPAFAF
ncbi:protein-L-isoaspartate O-methyltransferase family protein [Acetobacter conturbans]|uniref:Protein-L-isoaspartate O-methyltransferase n=1 Tax=Acetobacter conturbans TaxID=1737472 RepID=A0ABX0K1U5_9PROT|nr:protein-L-isoaspartate O-methyltransferase [Acetobacter conturbans]NHN89684.1 protein-L-isoaspartate O-methyltransferase [Acetobacter conturbans]